MPLRNETAAPAGAEHTTLYVAIEISRKSWVVGIKSPVNDRIGLHTLVAANVDALRDLIERHRAKAEQVLDCQSGLNIDPLSACNVDPFGDARRRSYR